MGINPIRTQLSGENAFYNQPDYVNVTRSQLGSRKALKNPTYTSNISNTKNKVWHMVKKTISKHFLPARIYRGLHSLAGKVAILPTSSPSLYGLRSDFTDQLRDRVKVEKNRTHWRVKRITIKVNGCTIDASIMGRESTLENGRWVLASNPNCGTYEGQLHDRSFKQILTDIKGNAIVFNYPGVGSSSGVPNRKTMAKAYRALLNFLEDQENGIGAREIIGYGRSIGGGVQGEALRRHQLKDDINYVFVKDRTFTDLSSAASRRSWIWRPLGAIVKLLGWNMSSVESSKNLTAPEIILQTSDVTDISEAPDNIIHDRIIAPEASLARRLLLNQTCPHDQKHFMGIPEMHNDPFSRPTLRRLTNKINELLGY